MTDSIKTTRQTHLLSQMLLESIKMGHAIFLNQLHFVVEFLLGHLAVVVVDILGLGEHLLLTLPFLRQLLQHLLLLRLQKKVQKGDDKFNVTVKKISYIQKVQRREAKQQGKVMKTARRQWTHKKEPKRTVSDGNTMILIAIFISYGIYTEQNYKRNTFVFAPIFHELNSKI